MQEDVSMAVDEERWKLLKIRWVSFIAVVAYPFCGFLYNVLTPQSFDPFWHRMIIFLAPLAAFLLSFTNLVSRRNLEHLFHFGFALMTAHCFFIIERNNIPELYVLGGYCMMFSAGAAMLTEGILLWYFLYCISICCAIAYLHPTNAAYFLLFGSGTALIICYSGLKCVLHLANLLRKSHNLVQNKNRTLDSMLNSLGQGFFTFDRQGICQPVFSNACLTLLEQSPAGKFVGEVLRIPDGETESFKSWLAMLFAGRLNSEQIAQMGPRLFPHSNNRHITLEYNLVLSASGEVIEVVAVATDRTDERRAELSAEAERKYANMVTLIVKQKDLFRGFISDFNSKVAAYSEMSTKDFHAQKVSDEFKRFLHTMKGGAALFGMNEVADLIHRLEDEWTRLAQTPTIGAGSATAEVLQEQVAILNQSMHGFVKKHAQILGTEFSVDRIVEMPLPALAAIISSPDFTRLGPSLREHISDASKLPVSKYFEVYGALILKTAKAQKKQVEPILFENSELLIYPEPYRKLFASFVHVFRNAVDHGLENSEDRVLRGKSAAGHVKVKFEKIFEQGRSWLVINFQDDGAGIDPNKLRKKLVRNGRGEDAASLTGEQLLQVIFEPGFSTKDKVTELSGRGVGMDSVRACVIELGGEISVSSELGIGTNIRVKVPELSIKDAKSATKTGMTA